MSTSPEHSSSKIDVKGESIPSPNINTPPSLPLHAPIKPDELHPLTQGLDPSSPTLPISSKSRLIRLDSLSAIPYLSPMETSLSVAEEQGNTSPLGHNSSSLSEKHFKGDLVKNRETESNILAKGPEWVAKNLLGLRDGD